MTVRSPISTVNPSIDHLVAGAVLNGRYRIEHRLGLGGYGEVVAAHDLRDGRPVAIKILHNNATQNDPRALGRMRQEAEILRAIRHPNIVEIFDLGTCPEGEFLVMELLEGQSIAKFLVDEGPIQAQRALPLVHQMLSALAAAHAKQVLHRDIKPDNILLCAASSSSAERAKLLDFGIAKAHRSLNDESEDGVTMVKTRVGSFVGTPRYAAPEQAVGDPVGPESDLFSLGLVISEWLTGSPRITGERYGDVMAQLVKPSPFDLSDCPQRWQPWLERMLDKSPSRRFESAEQAIDALVAQVPSDLTGDTNTFPGRGPSPAIAELREGDISMDSLNDVATQPDGTNLPMATSAFLETMAPLELDYAAVGSTESQRAAHRTQQTLIVHPTPAVHEKRRPIPDDGFSFGWAAFFGLVGFGGFLLLFIIYRVIAG